MLLRLLSDDGEISDVLGEARPFTSLRLLDLSAGCGVVGLACAAAGAACVVLTDMPSRVPTLLVAAKAAGAANVAVRSLAWGCVASLVTVAAVSASEGAVQSNQQPAFDLCLASDLLYIAQQRRGGLAECLADTLADVLRTGVAAAVLFVYEERESEREAAFMLSLAAIGLCVVTRPAAALREEECLAARGGCAANGHARTHIWTPRLFWEPPPLRLFVLRATCLRSPPPQAACARCGRDGGEASGV